MDNSAKKFKFPIAVLNQINECSNGFFLVVVNEKKEFEVFQNLENPVTQLGLINFLEIFSGSMQENMRQKPLFNGGSPEKSNKPDEEGED